jgi:hypothetical protein
MSILIALFPDSGDFIDGHIAEVVLVVFQMKDFAIDLDNSSAQT